VLERNFQINVMALLHLARWAAPITETAGGGALIVTGNTSSIRGKARFVGFAPTKAAQRILAESVARQMGPRGVHVAFLGPTKSGTWPTSRARPGPFSRKSGHLVRSGRVCIGAIVHKAPWAGLTIPQRKHVLRFGCRSRWRYRRRKHCDSFH
jgi:NAD(P)-dependent dehydrogenase (short-subunit alcohol dehydrogenase family)